MVKKEWIEKGYADEPVEEGTDLRKEIRRMCAEKNAVLLAHYSLPERCRSRRLHRRLARTGT